MWTLFILVGTVSIAIHVVVLFCALLPDALSEIKWAFPRGKGKVPQNTYGRQPKWYMNIPWEAIIIVMGCVTFGILLAVMFAKGYSTSGSLIGATLAIAPHLFEWISEVLADLMAEIIFVGFIPGGRAGIVIGGVASILLNIFELYLAVNWTKSGKIWKVWRGHAK